MTKEDYGEFHRLLAITKYELVEQYIYLTDEKMKKQFEKQIKAVDTLMKVLYIRGNEDN